MHGSRSLVFSFIPSLEKDHKFIKVNAIKFPDGEVSALRRRLDALRREIPILVALSFGADARLDGGGGVGRRGGGGGGGGAAAAGGFDFAIVADFHSYAGYQKYASHPSHRALSAEVLSPMVVARSSVQFSF